MKKCQICQKFPGKKELDCYARTLSLSEGTCLVFVSNPITLIALPDIKENLETIACIAIKTFIFIYDEEKDSLYSFLFVNCR